MTSIEADDVGLRGVGSNGRPWQIGWSDLVAVDIRTTSRGPFEDDVFYVLTDRAGLVVIIPQDLTSTSVLGRLQQLPGFDNETFIAAMGCTDDSTFVCWRAGT